jgi:protein-L-isoaspartate O-methyltransferase
MPVGSVSHQELIRVVRQGENAYVDERLGAVAFVPLIGEHGWKGARG